MEANLATSRHEHTNNRRCTSCDRKERIRVLFNQPARDPDMPRKQAWQLEGRYSTKLEMKTETMSRW